jgi:ribosome biogenesis protein BRX1
MPKKRSKQQVESVEEPAVQEQQEDAAEAVVLDAPKTKKSKRNGAPAPAAPPAPASAEQAEEEVEDPHFRNKQRVLILASRGITQRYRHLMNDLRQLLPHSKKENKVEHKSKNLTLINELAEIKSCNNVIFLEVRKKADLYVWIGKTPDGPIAKFLCHNVHTMDELKLTGNCLQGSRPLLVFDQLFDTVPHLQLLKEIFTQAFGTPKDHPKSKPFVDHVISFFIVDGRIWLRNYQVVEKDDKNAPEPQLVEIGPRMVLNPVKIFSGSFCGDTLYANPDYVSPNLLRRMQRNKKLGRYAARAQATEAHDKKKAELVMPLDEVEEMFRD